MEAGPKPTSVQFSPETHFETWEPFIVYKEFKNHDWPSILREIDITTEMDAEGKRKFFRDYIASKSDAEFANQIFPPA